ncbi:hypothetical protein GGR88_000705 [Sphingomonas jejuensis]|uniref:BLUF domain-containing protein n=1 Tax=Sphingomonas jejuensis TaxID=904715 RepID=A0ABX0XKH1_9SPHN|nr:BLUF domain-containing protein [Sphingomonas jejuensis]NJC33231.1 hypothetical protein [Sphingomonas jejuensis]
MLQYCYISSARPGQPVDVDEILATSRRNNQQAGLSGLLIFDGRRFLQVLEGEGAAVRSTVERIQADPRHRAIVKLSERRIEAREFGDWAMACNRVADAGDSRNLASTVDALTEGVADANTRALFRSFARIDRAA